MEYCPEWPIARAALLESCALLGSPAADVPSEYVLPNCRIAGGAPYGIEGTSLKWLCEPALLGTTYGVIRDAEATRICNQSPA